MFEKFFERHFRIELFERDKNFRLSFSKLKYSYDYALTCNIVDGFQENQIAQKWIYGQPFPKQISELGDSHILLNENKIQEEINWILLSIRKFKEEINKFISYKFQFESKLFTGKYDEAEEILNMVESEVSVSLWSIENRFLLIELKKGLKENTSFLNDINTQNKKGFIQYLSHFYSLKAEKELSVNRYDVNLLKFLLPLYEKGLQSDIEYYYFKLNPFFKPEYDHLSEILAYENYNSIIDKYLSLNKVLNLLLIGTNSKNKELIEFIKNRLNYLDNKLDSHQIKLLRALVDDKNFEIELNDIDLEALNIFDYYTSGVYEKCQSKIEDILNKNPIIIEMYPIYVKSLIYQGKKLDFDIPNTFQQLILSKLFELYSKQSNPVDSGIVLKKIAYNLSGFSNISYFLINILKGEVENDNSFAKLAIINTSFLNPKLADIHHNSLDFFRIFKRAKPKSNTIKLLSLIETKELFAYDGDDIDKNTLRIQKALLFQKNENYKEASEIWLDMLNIELTNFDLETVLINLFYCKAKIRDFDYCINLFVEYYFKNMYLTHRFNVNLVKEEIKENKYKGIKYSVQLPIFFYLTNSEGYDIHTAYECFLLENDCDKPSDLILQTRENDYYVIFFFKNICNLEIFKHSPFITSTKMKLNERIKICQFLKEVDSDNSSDYLEEENLLSKRLIIQKGLQEIDESKIYVNQESIILNELKDQKSVFKRYVSIAELSTEKGVSFINLGSEDVYNMSLEKEQKDDLEFSKDPQYDIFKEMFFEIRDKFLYSKYGLKLNISTRIRHGVLEGEIRSDFAILNLVTEKEKASEVYKINKYWEKYLKLNNSMYDLERFNTLMSDFTKQIDSYIYDEILSKYLLIKTEKENPDGWLDYEFDEVKLQLLYSLVYKNIKEYSDFVEYIFKDLWNRTVKNLEVIKNNIKFDFRNKFFQAIQNLESTLQASTINVPDELYNNLAEIKTKIDNKLTRIATWFTITDSHISDFDLNKIIEVSSESLQSNYTTKQLILERREISFHGQLKGKYFTHLVYLLRIFFQNILDYSNEDSVSASIEITKIENQLVIKIENPLRSDEDIPQLKKKIQIENDVYKSQLDKRSGLYKALNNIKTNLDDETNEMILDVVDNRFCVLVKLNLSILMI